MGPAGRGAGAALSDLTAAGRTEGNGLSEYPMHRHAGIALGKMARRREPCLEVRYAADAMCGRRVAGGFEESKQ